MRRTPTPGSAASITAKKSGTRLMSIDGGEVVRTKPAWQLPIAPNDSAARVSEQGRRILSAGASIEPAAAVPRARAVARSRRDSFPLMKEYQAVMLRLSRQTRDDEDALTDLLNERSRSGWAPSMMAQDGLRLTVVFERDTPER